MGFRMRKSFKVMPGVRMTVTPRGVSASVGGKAGRVTVNSRGRVTQTVRVPGTGVSYATSSSARGPQVGRRQPTPASRPDTPAPPAPTKPPGMFAPKWEKALFKTLSDRDYGSLERLAASYPEARSICMLLDAFMTEGPEGDARGKAILEELWAVGYDPSRDRFLSTYAAGSAASVTLAPGVRATMPLSRDLIGLTLAELRQEVGDLPGAISVVESLEPSLLAAVSLADLYIAQGRFEDVIELTNGIMATDDFSSFLLAQRGVAFRESGHHDTAPESFKAALSRRSQPAELKHHTLAERALTYLREGKFGMARKDYERILAENPHHPGLAEALAALPERRTH